MITSDTVLWKCLPTIQEEENDVHEVEVVIAHLVIIAKTDKEGADQRMSRAGASLFTTSWRRDTGGFISGALYTWIAEDLSPAVYKVVSQFSPNWPKLSGIVKIGTKGMYVWRNVWLGQQAQVVILISYDIKIEQKC